MTKLGKRRQKMSNLRSVRVVEYMVPIDIDKRNRITQ